MPPTEREEDKTENFIIYHYNREVKEMHIGGIYVPWQLLQNIYLDYSIENKLYSLSVN